MSDRVLEKVISRGYWKVVFRPNEYIAERQDIQSLSPLLRESAVDFRGWSFPQWGRDAPETYANYIAQSIDFRMFKEYWRYYQSGQFIHYAGLVEDWDEDRRTLFNPHEEILPPNKFISVLHLLFRMTEVYEFAARLATKDVLSDSFEISIGLNNLANRQLTFLDPFRSLRDDRICRSNQLMHARNLSKAEILASAKDLAMEETAWFLRRMGWDSVDTHILRADQEKLLTRTW